MRVVKNADDNQQIIFRQVRMKAYFHTLPDVESKPPRALEGSGIAEDKRYLNAKSPWTLAHLEMKVLQGFYNNPAVPPSMKTKLKSAMMIKPTLKPKSKKKLYGLLKGGLAGVSKASGFIQRLMAENKKKHEGKYMNPTWELHPESTMKKPVKFDYKKLATTEQGGLKRNGNPYGASPFITQHFQHQRPLEEKEGETEAQKRARLAWNTRRLLRVAENRGAEEPIHEDLQHHFGNIQPEGLFVDAEAPERAVRATRPAPPPKAGWEDEMKDALTKPDLIKHLREYIEEYKEDHHIDAKANKILRYVIENPRAKLAEVIAHLKESGETKGLANGTISPILKEMRQLLKNGVEAFIEERKKTEDLERRSGKMKEVLKKNIPLKKLRKEAKSKLEELKYEKEEREHQKEVERRVAERKREKEQERLDEIERKKQREIDEKREAEEAQALQEKEFKDSRDIAKKKLKANLPPKAQMDKWKETWARFKGRILEDWEKDYWFGDVLRRWYGPGSFPGKSKEPEVVVEDKDRPKEPKLKYEDIPGEFYPNSKTPKRRLTEKSQKEADEYNAYVRKGNERYTLTKKNIEEIALEFIKWLFTKALPLYDYKFVDDIEVGKFKKFMILTNDDGKFSFAWGLDDFDKIAKDMINPFQAERTGFSFSKVFKIDHNKEGDEWSELSFDDVYAKNTPRGQTRRGMVMLGNNPPGEKNIEWAMPQGLAQIIRPLWEELMEYTEEEVPKNEIVNTAPPAVPAGTTGTSEFPKSFTTRMKNIATILRADAGLSLAKIASKLNKDYNDRGANGDLTKSAINKAVNEVKEFLKKKGGSKRGQGGSVKPQMLIMCGE